MNVQKTASVGTERLAQGPDFRLPIGPIELRLDLARDSESGAEAGISAPGGPRAVTGSWGPAGPGPATRT